jgi:hypothetical protein
MSEELKQKKPRRRRHSQKPCPECDEGPAFLFGLFMGILFTAFIAWWIWPEEKTEYMAVSPMDGGYYSSGSVTAPTETCMLMGFVSDSGVYAASFSPTPLPEMTYKQMSEKGIVYRGKCGTGELYMMKVDL